MSSAVNVGDTPITFTPALGDNVIYTILNAAPQTFVKTVDRANVDIGDVLTYTVTVNNPNNFIVNNVLVTGAITVGTTYLGNLTVSAPCSGTTYVAGSVTYHSSVHRNPRVTGQL